MLVSRWRDPPCCFRRESQELADGCAGFTARLQLQPFPQQGQRYDHRSHVEIGADQLMRITHRCGKRVREQRGDHTVGKCYAYAEPDQRVHIGRAMYHSKPAATVVGRGGPKHDWSAQGQLEKAQGSRAASAQSRSQHVRRHRDAHRRDTQAECDPEVPPDAGDFAVIHRVHRHQGLERHAALRTMARTDLPHLGVHGTCIDRAGGHGRSPLARMELSLNPRPGS